MQFIINKVLYNKSENEENRIFYFDFPEHYNHNDKYIKHYMIINNKYKDEYIYQGINGISPPSDILLILKKYLLERHIEEYKINEIIDI